MPDRPDPVGLAVETSELIGRNRAGWKNAKGSVFCYTRFDPLHGETEAREHPPLGVAHGVVVHPDDYPAFLDRVMVGEIRY